MAGMNWLLAFHVLGAVFVIGPLAVLPMAALRLIREGDAAAVPALSRTISILGWFAVAVGALGAGAFHTISDEFRTRLGTGWFVSSLVLTLVAIILILAVVVPQLRAAVGDTEPGDVTSPSAGHATAAAAGKMRSRYVVLAATSGIASLLFLLVAVIMVVH